MTRLFQITLFGIWFLLFAACSTPSARFQPSQAPTAAVLEHNTGKFFNPGPKDTCGIIVESIDGQSTKEVFPALAKPFKIQPGIHRLGLKLYGQYGVEADAVISLNFRSSTRYKFEAATVGQNIVLELINLNEARQVEAVHHIRTTKALPSVIYNPAIYRN